MKKQQYEIKKMKLWAWPSSKIYTFDFSPRTFLNPCDIWDLLQILFLFPYYICTCYVLAKSASCSYSSWAPIQPICTYYCLQTCD